MPPPLSWALHPEFRILMFRWPYPGIMGSVMGQTIREPAVSGSALYQKRGKLQQKIVLVVGSMYLLLVMFTYRDGPWFRAACMYEGSCPGKPEGGLRKVQASQPFRGLPLELSAESRNLLQLSSQQTLLRAEF